MGRIVTIAVAAVAMVATPAMAKDRVGYKAISAGSLSQAEATLTRERIIFPSRPELMLNLAAVYARTGRIDQARAPSPRRTAREAVPMDLADGAVLSSYEIARRGLARLGATIASR